VAMQSSGSSEPRRRTRVALRQSEERFRLLVEGVKDYAIFMLDPHGYITTWNEGAQRIKGYEGEEIVGEHFSVFYTEGDVERGHPDEELRIAAAEGSYEEEGPRVRKDGSTFWASVLITALRDEEGDLRGFAKVTRDITARKEAEDRERLLIREKAALERAADTLESISDAFYAIDEEWRFTYINGKAEELWGRSREELLGKNIWDEFPETVGSESYRQIKRAMEGGVTTEFETISPVLGAWVAGRAYPSAEGLSVYFRDVTERKRAEDEIRRSEEAQRFLAEASSVLASSLDYRETLASVARLAVPALADWCAVDVLEEDGHLERLAVEHPDPEKVRMAYELERRYPPDPDASGGLHHVLRTGKSEMMAEIPEELVERAARDERHRELLRKLDLRSYMVVPLVARSRTLGAISFVSAESGRRYGEHDLWLAEELARRAAYAVDNARLYEEAQSSRNELEAILRGVADGITAQNPSGKIIYANDTAARLTGFPSAGDLVEAPLDELMARFEIMDEEGRRFSADKLPGRRALAGEEGAEEVMRFRILATGEVRWAIVKAMPIFGEQGTVRMAVNVFRDITERRRTEEELRASEERFRATFEQAAVGVAHVGLDGTWLRVNNKLFEITGYPREELIQKTFQDITHPDDLGADLEQARQLLAGEIKNYSMEKRYIKMDGSTIWINLTGSLVREPSGEPAYFIAVIEDITERKRAEQAQSQSESRYRAVVEQSADGIYLVDAGTGRILETNPALQDMLGYGTDELQGMELHEIVAHDPEDVYANVERTLREGKRFIRERDYRRKDGSVVEVEVAASAIDYGDKQVICAAIRDITERKRAEEARREIRDAERRRIARDLHDGVLQDLSYTSAAIGMTMLQADDTKFKEQLQAATDAVRRGAQGLREVVNDLRLEDEDGRPFAEVVESVVRRNRTMAKHVEIIMDVEERVPAAPLGETGTQASRIIQEALTNARRHSRAKRILVSLRMYGPDLIAEVADDGIGLGAEMLPGVGLSSMRERVAIIGGDLEIESEPERGTRVRLRIPLAEGGQG
jgi:PAS domain S-box-containing protein